ncbi:DUF4440 domain-containing protein [Marinicellulosiphila megalodicopiae]|uniref:nuclear transport factor 2 family protein n=1 Tax=Marinicellulosiphila megalodicopiae TaxID=2724896 RepID=UPI003BB01687
MNALIELEKSLHQFETRQNQSLVQKLLHPEFREIGMSGTYYDVKTINEMLLQEEKPTAHIHSQDYECLNFDENTKQLIYKSVIIGSDGQLTSFAIRTSIWINKNNNWTMKYHQGTPCSAFEIKI